MESGGHEQGGSSIDVIVVGAIVVGATAVVATALAIVGAPALSAATIAVAASLACARAAFRYRLGRTTWTALSVWAAAQASNTLLLQLRAPTGSWLDRLPEVALATCALSAVIGGWLIVRPMLTDIGMRRHALIAFPATVIGLLGILISDAAFSVGTSTITRFLGVFLIAVAGPVSAVNIAALARALYRRRRFAEVTLAIGILAHTVTHALALIVESIGGIWLAIALSSSAMLVAALLPSARSLGITPGLVEHNLRVRVWPAILTGSTAVAAWVFARSFNGIFDRGTIAGAVVFGALIVALFAGRELAGPRKPLVVPFGAKDRAMHSLPSQLLSGSVRLVGRPVHRVRDGSIAGIEAEPSWSTSTPPSISLSDAAHAAGLEAWLQSITLTSAQAHLPAVLLNLSGDDPFLSVPFDAAHEDQSGIDGDLDGLLLRTDSPATTLVGWQNRGAMVQAAASRVGDGAVVDVVRVDPGEAVPPIAMGLVQGRTWFSADAARSGAMFVVDDSVQPTNLSVILSLADPTDNGEVGPSRVRASGQVDSNRDGTAERVSER